MVVLSGWWDIAILAYPGAVDNGAIAVKHACERTGANGLPEPFGHGRRVRHVQGLAVSTAGSGTASLSRRPTQVTCTVPVALQLAGAVLCVSHSAPSP